MPITGFGQIIHSGLTDRDLDINRDAFLPCRNLIFLTCGAAYAYRKNAPAVAIGLVDESAAIFPDQTREFVTQAERMVSYTMGRNVRFLAPLLNVTKAEVIAIAREIGLEGSYSCHSGTLEPCGECISCIERERASKSTQEGQQ
jgi:7-cyano-7-deazaguanine synthase